MNRHSSAGSPLSSRAVPSRSARPRRRHLEWLQTTHGLLVWLGLSASLAHALPDDVSRQLDRAVQSFEFDRALQLLHTHVLTSG